MTDFNMHVDVDYTIDSDYHKNGRVELHLTLDKISADAFYRWLANGCEGELAITKKGCRLAGEMPDIPKADDEMEMKETKVKK